MTVEPRRTRSRAASKAGPRRVAALCGAVLLVTLLPTAPQASGADHQPSGTRAAALQPASGPRGGIVKIQIGRSVLGRPLWAYRKGDPRADRSVLILGQMHGDERAGVRVARYVKNHLRVSPTTDVWIVPTMNPDGYRAGTRRNARDVDLNRNWPTNWEPGDGAGSRALSEPETRAMFRLLKRVQPRFIASLHQPFGVVGRSDKNMRYVRRLSRQLDLPISRVQVGDCHGPNCPPSPTMTSWYNERQPGYSVTVELPERPGRRYLTRQVAPGILAAQHAD